MKNKSIYLAPAIHVFSVTAKIALNTGSPAPSATFISNPGVGDAEDGDVIGTESRINNGIWDE